MSYSGLMVSRPLTSDLIIILILPVVILCLDIIYHQSKQALKNGQVKRTLRLGIQKIDLDNL